MIDDKSPITQIWNLIVKKILLLIISSGGEAKFPLSRGWFALPQLDDYMNLEDKNDTFVIGLQNMSLEMVFLPPPLKKTTTWNPGATCDINT